MLRRTFLQALPAGVLAVPAAPGAPAVAANLKLGYDTYSIRAWKWKAPQLLEYAGARKLDAIQISDLSEFESLEPAYLGAIKAQAARLGVVIDAGMGCVCPSSKAFSAGPPAHDRLLEGLRAAHAVGARSLRCFLGSEADRTPSIEAHIENTLRVFRSVRQEALDLNVKIALENHSDLQARELRAVIEAAGADFTGACLDTGNAIWTLEDPLAALEILAPYVVTTHVRDAVIFEHARGAAAQWVALGDGVIDWGVFTEAFRRLCPSSPLQLEIITGRAPRVLPYLEAELWKAFPKMPAGDFARFAALARRGHPFMGTMVVEDQAGPVPQAMTEALREQQRLDLERSLDYARTAMKAGRA
jgi:3-oxoisoapionate decarboxylase